MKKTYIILLLLLPFLAGAQGENDNWYFGYHCRVNFSGASPVVPPISQIDAFEACGTVSDSSGKLLFYTDGRVIFNRSHQVMQNGSDLKGKPSSQQLAIVKHPGNDNQYFVFTTGYNDPDSTHCHIMYSIVDMSLGNVVNGSPLGAVLSTAKNISVLDYQGNKFRGEAITVVPSPYNTFWVLIPSAKKLYSYTVNNNGFNNGAPVVSNLDFPTTMVPENHFSVKVSPKLSTSATFSHYLCISCWYNPGYVNKVFSFNDVTGQITNNYTLAINSVNSYLPEFNKDASVLYLGYYKMYAFDLLTSTPTNINYMEIFDLATHGGDCGSIQRNKYDDIYFSVPNNKFLGKIINPDVYGPNISVDLNNIPLGMAPYGDSADAKYGLPQLVPVLSNTYYPCMNDLVLSTFEMHNNFTYHIGNQITTEADYTIDPHQDITMKAGNNILLLPNTYVMAGASYLAKIERCNPYSKQTVKTGKSQENISLSVDLDKDGDKSDDILVYPNPASTLVTIDTRNQKLLNWELYDMAGRLVSKGNTNSVKVAGLPQNVYLLRIGLANGRNSHKKITVQ